MRCPMRFLSPLRFESGNPMTSDRASFCLLYSQRAKGSPDLSLWKPLRPRLTPEDWTARIRSALFKWLKNDIIRCLPVSANQHQLKGL